MTAHPDGLRWRSSPVFFVALAALAGMPAACRAQASPRLTSASGRFVAAGLSAPAAAGWLRWAEEVAARLDRYRESEGTAWPDGPILLQPLAPARGGPVARHTVQAGAWRGALLIPDAYPPGGEEAALALCALWLHAEVHAARTAGGRAPRAAAEVPDWLSVGLAQNLYAEWRDRNRALTRYGELPPLGVVLQWQRVPVEWYVGRACSGLAVDWWADTATRRQGLRVLIERLAEGEPITAEWLAGRLGYATAAELEPSWRRWQVAQRATVLDLGAVSTALLDDLDRRLSLDLPAPPPGPDAPADGQPGTLSHAAKLPLWLRQLAAGRAEELRRMAAGKAPEYSQVAQAYAEFFDSVANGRRTGVRRERLEAAERLRREIGRLTREREAYLDRIEAEEAENSRTEQRPSLQGESDAPGVPAEGQAGLEKSAIELYLDAIEANRPP